jgi:hypothetical protein
VRATVLGLRITFFQIVEEEKLELEAILNQQRREDRYCFILDFRCVL